MQASRKPQGLSEYAERTIRRKARSMVGKAGFTSNDVDDIEQEIRLDLLERLSKYDASQCAHSTFVTCVIDHKISKIIRYRKQEIRDYRRESCSLNEPIQSEDGEPIERIDTIDEDKNLSGTGKRNRTLQESAELRLDICAVLTDKECLLAALADLTLLFSYFGAFRPRHSDASIAP